jgi:hypothetical protein
MRGENINASMHHDFGAYAQCGKCGRYSDNPRALGNEWPCECGESAFWSGSFKRPTEDSLWSDLQPITGAAQNAA